jgi:hypothetical protein
MPQAFLYGGVRGDKSFFGSLGMTLISLYVVLGVRTLGEYIVYQSCADG